MKALHFGAGNIGRGFIGLLLSQSGYEVVFSDVNESLVRSLQERGSYTVTIADENGEHIPVHGVRAIDGRDLALVAEEVATADLVTTAVGVPILKHIAPGIAAGIKLRMERGGAPLHIIACENAIGASTQLKEHVMGLLSPEEKQQAASIAAFPDSAVDRIVPLQHHEDPLAVTVEPFYEWVINRSQMFPGAMEIGGVHYVDDLIPYIERKLFTVNTGHCSAAYAGYRKGYDTIQEAMKDEEVVGLVAGALQETGSMLVHAYGFDAAEHEAYIRKILDRFRNPYLRDEVVRVGRSPIRKLSPDDRLVRPALRAWEQGGSTGHLTKVMALALKFDYAEDPEAAQLQSMIAEKGARQAFAEVSGLGADHELTERVMHDYEQ
ncbi:mannitol-1-phosphate 5-dehydrogenase [Paenibacillus albilobatus]|uniref:Mannitol-1-phosphate 5-dehydrogenase n=1 Tax=Paenibacillus albilobatus TaxID=2716884 RepID=A0A919XJU4_9BACL|nr:mannitol-1-phosphate 5-dehydrogenase [Paenibacillus albilobatus]GIO34039.1 mannitol-1-phosphate 5-dehydrogenase [Paenibacillus albilobatus]